MSDDLRGWNGRGRSEPDAIRQLLARLAEQDRRIAALERGSPLRAAGIGMTPDGMTVDSSLDVLGALSSTGSASFGGDTTISGALEVTGSIDVSGDASFSGDTTIGGNAAVTGTLSLPAGIIDNDALANPLEARADYNDVTNIPYTTTETNRAPVTIQVPNGFTTAIITSVTTAYGFNSTSNDSGIAVRARVETSGGGFRYTGISLQGLPANWSGTAQATLITAIDVSDSTWIRALSQVQAGWSHIPADPNHFVATDVQVMFTR